MFSELEVWTAGTPAYLLDYYLLLLLLFANISKAFPKRLTCMAAYAEPKSISTVQH